MTKRNELLIYKAYEAFNARDIDGVLHLMDPGVRWPNGWEGGYVNGHNEVRDYWTRQWNELNPTVTPVSLTEKDDGRLEADVHQVVKDKQGNLLFDGNVKHIYSFANGLITEMEIRHA